MGETLKRHKVSEYLNVKTSEDRISNLPSSLIGYILSFLPTKYAVATSVLSTKWKHFWTLTTNLEFDDRLFRNPQHDRLTTSLQTSFTSFIYRVLLLVETSSLRKFHLNCKRSYDVCHVNTWICSVLKCNVQELYLSVPMENFTRLPENLFTCRTLVELELGMSFVMNIPDSVSLPCLKVLDLTSNMFSDDSSLTRLLSGCPVLERLSMAGCIGSGVEVINISAPMLTTLIMQLLPNTNSFGSFNYKIVLDTPILKQLSICDYIAEGYELKGLNDLTFACISILPSLDSDDSAEFQGIHCEALNDLLKGISGVRTLYLQDDCIQAIVRCMCRLPRFKKLTYLELGVDDECKLTLLPELLQSSPQLETLIFYKGFRYRDFHGDKGLHWEPPQDVPNCLVFHLKLIKIFHFREYKEELEIVEYFVKNACILERVIIHCITGMSSDKKLEVSRNLLVMERASRICQIKLL